MNENVFLGKINFEKPKAFTVKCKNNSNKDIVLEKIGISCNCIQIRSLDNKMIHAHDSIFFSFSFIPDGIGYVEKRMDFYFDLLQEPYSVKVSARIVE